MNVRHDRSYISENSRDLIGRGYAAEVLDTLRFRFTYTQVERDANRSRAQTQPYADGIAERAKAAMLRSAEMEQIMATIAEQFVCYQYDDRKYPFRDGGTCSSGVTAFSTPCPAMGLMAEIIPTSRSASMSSTQQKRGKRSAIPSWL